MGGQPNKSKEKGGGSEGCDGNGGGVSCCGNNGEGDEEGGVEEGGDEHECVDNCSYRIGCGGAAGYRRIVDAFKNYEVGGMARCIMICPLHRKLPAMVVLLAPTCNKFKADPYVKEQWVKVRDICNKYLGHIVGFVTGHASDGDARRRKLQQAAMLSALGRRFGSGWFPG